MNLNLMRDYITKIFKKDWVKILTIIVLFLTIPISCITIYQFFFGENNSKLKPDEISELRVDSIYNLVPHVQFKPPSNIIKLWGVSYWISLTNISDQTCRIRFYISGDTLTTSNFLRQRILDFDTSKAQISLFPDFPDYTIRPKENKEINIKTYLIDDSYDYSYLHILILYENSFGFFDTYVVHKMKYVFDPNTPIKPKIDTVKKTVEYRAPKLIELINNYIRTDPPYIYSEDEIKYVEKIIEILDSKKK